MTFFFESYSNASKYIKGQQKKNTFILGKHCRCDITPETCVLYEKCQNAKDCPGGQCVYGDFGGVEYHYCQCNLTETQCKDYETCESNADCNGGMCTQMGFKVKICLCDVTTPKPELPCKDVVNCQSDDDCNGGICQITEPNSWNDCIQCPQTNSTPSTTRSTTTISTSTIITTGKTLSKEFTTTI
jgi:hypothetical protein